MRRPFRRTPADARCLNATAGSDTPCAAISAFVIPVLMGGARVRVVGRLIYDQLLISYQWPSASAIATLLVIATTTLSFIALAITRRASRLEQGT